MNSMASDVKAYIAEGGLVNLSFGGTTAVLAVYRLTHESAGAISKSGRSNTNQHVQQACKDAGSLAKLIAR
jgi:hypothetical protein